MWNGSRGNYSVQWPAISQNTLNKLGKSTITGYFLGSNIPVTATINVCDLANDDLGRIAYIPDVGFAYSYESNQFCCRTETTTAFGGLETPFIHGMRSRRTSNTASRATMR